MLQKRFKANVKPNLRGIRARKEELDMCGRALGGSMDQVVVHVKANIQWAVAQSTSSDRYIGVCEPMNLSMEADSLDEMHSLIDETMQLVLTDLLQDGDLDAYLKDHGWSAKEHLPAASEDVVFDIPWQMITEGRLRDSQRRVAEPA